MTGGCGFIGSSLVKQNIKNCGPTSIVILDNFSTGAPEDLAEVTSFVLSSPAEYAAR